MLTANSFQKLLRPLGLAILIIGFGLTACSPANLPATGGEGTNEVPPQAVLEAATWLSQDLGITIEDIEIVEFEQVEWPDACLGVPQEGQACAQVITPGFKVNLEVNGQPYELRSDQEGKLIIQAPQE